MSRSAFLTGIRSIEIGEDANLSSEYCVKIKVNSCAICGSDIRIYQHGNERVSYPTVLGHEVSGVVTETNHPQYSVGDRLSLGADIPCGKCNKCKLNKPNLCSQNLAIGYQLKGGFTEFMEIDKRVFDLGPVVKIPKELNIETACLGEPLACAINGVEKVNMSSGGDVLIFGGGPIGIMIGFLCKKIYGCNRLDYVEPSDYRKKSIDQIGIADNIYDPKMIEEDIQKYESKYDYVFTACSVFKTHQIGLNLLSNGGYINFFGGLPKPSPSMPIITNDLHYREITLTGSHGSTPLQHSKAIKLINKYETFFTSLITHRFSLDDIEKGLDLASEGKGIKVLIKP